MSFTASDIKKLRAETGAGVVDCKQALTEAEGDYSQAKEIVMARGLARAEKKASRQAREGVIASYVHANSKVASMVELLCETDFVARNGEFCALAHDLAMQVTAMNPESLSDLLAQDFIKNPSASVENTIKQLSGKIGEKISLVRFVRYQLGVE